MKDHTVVTKDQLMYHVARGEMIESFEHSELGWFDVTAMREVATRNGQLIEIDMSQVEPFVREQRVFEMDRVNTLSDAAWRDDPILYVRIDEPAPIGTSYLMIDGAHRVIRRKLEGMQSVLAFILTERDIVRPDFSKVGDVRDVFNLDWGDVIVDGKIVKRESK